MFTFETSNFECGVQVVKNFKDEITYAKEDGTVVTENFITTNMICNIVSDQSSYAVPVASSDYLIRDSNALDDLEGML